MIGDLINHPQLKEFCSYIKRHEMNKKAKVIGIDVGEEYLNLKLYVELLGVPSSTIIEEFLGPNATQEFLMYAPFWDKTRESSLALGFKVDSNNRQRKYFHIKFAECFDLVKHESKFMFLKFLKINPKTLLKGISYEIESDTNFFDKFYVYVRDPLDIAKVLLYKKINCDPKEVEELEIYATATTYKVNIINFTDSKAESKQNVWNSIPEKFHPKIKEVAAALNSQPMYTGVTKKNVYSVYYSVSFQKENILSI